MAIILPLNSFSLLRPVASLSNDEARRIKEICRETLEPYECYQCITSDRSREFYDTPALIHSLLFCLYSETTYAHVNADLLSQNATIPSLKMSLSQCSSVLFHAANLAVDAMLSIESRNYVQAWNTAKAARRSFFGCAKVFIADNNLTIPSAVLGHMIRAKHLYDSMHIMFQLIVR